MASELKSAITIKQAIDDIDNGNFLLPAIQRRFVWSTEQIELLFDSIMQNYPINTFMFWEVTDEKIKNKFRFYDFIKKYIEYERGNNEERKTKGYKDFKAIIDGYQRLNSLYIGLKGSYAYKNYVYRERKYQENEQDFPTRKLYLDLLNPIENDENKKVYDFRFLISNKQIKENENKTKKVINSDGEEAEIDCFWFDVTDILGFEDEHSVIMYLYNHSLDIGGFPGKTLLQLFTLINKKPLINYYLETDQNFDKVLYEFIRTNAAGTKLSFADLLMSVITASWEKEESTNSVREEIDDIIREVKNIGFDISQDFVLKTTIVFFSNDIRYSLKNIDSQMVKTIKNEWENITLSIKSAFELIKSISFNNYSLRAKNAVIPIIYFIYTKKLFDEINRDNRHIDNKRLIKKYLHISLLNKLFDGSSDDFLKRIRDILKESQSEIFPFDKLKETFKGSNRSFYLDDDKISMILRTPYDSLNSFYILSLLFPTFNFEFKSPNIDHLHPRDQFRDDNFKKFNEEEREFYQNYYNTVLNLALLSEEQIISKHKTALKDWIARQEKFNTRIRNELLIPEKIDLSFKNFKEFIEKRELILTEMIKENIY